MVPKIEIAGFRDFGSLGEAWRALEAEAAPFSFFQSWTWVGCLAEERFPDPVLVRATDAGRVVGLALFNRRGASLHLGESGEAGHDCIYVEHNGPLVAAGTAGDLPALMLRAAWGLRGIGRLVLSGVPPALLAAAGGVPARDRQDEAPFVDLAAIGRDGGGLLAALSANTRSQVRRSVRHFEAMGPLALSRPGSEAEEAAWFADLVSLHAERWRRSGLAGAFAEPFMGRFHAALMPRARGRGEADLWRISAGAETLGYLYNFRHRGTVYAYQSGLRAFPGTAQARPGLVGHWLAIEEALAAGLGRYDFLAGPARYKRSLATASVPLAWGERVPRASAAGLLALGLGAARRLRNRWGSPRAGADEGRGGST
ncbi:MAG: GNAT family N-acetyltransferase [Acetobacteraceae bacterium]|nr:GNAT family N-acetyltransferase [Acetobacteraceae bacterium]